MSSSEPICRVCGTRKNIVWHWVAHSPEQFIPLCKEHHKAAHKADPSLTEDFPDFEKTTISIRRGTKIRLKRRGQFGETWDVMLNRLMQELDEYDRVKRKWRSLI